MVRCVDDPLGHLRNLALDVVAHSAELPLPRPHGPLDRAIHLRLLDWDVDRRGRGSPQVPASSGLACEFAAILSLRRS